MKKILLLTAVVFVFTGTRVFAQSGCLNSPENPTAVLALVGSAGAFLATARRRFRK